MSPEEARNAAVRQFGSVEQIQEAAREERVWRWADELRQDLRFGARMLWRNPGYSPLAILCLTLGIGTNAAVFSWIEGILFQSLSAGRASGPNVRAQRNDPRRGGLHRTFLSRLSRYSKKLHALRVVHRRSNHRHNPEHRRPRRARERRNRLRELFRRPWRSPILGRGFRPEEGTGRNAHPVTVISYETWKNRYKGDPDIIGKTQYLNGIQHTIIGVAPEKFYGTFVGYSFQFWVPISMQETFDTTGYKLEDRGERWIEGYAFFKPGVTRQQAQEEISAVAKRLEKEYPETDRGHESAILPLWKTPFNQAGGQSSTLGIALAVAFFVLLIACANVSNLLLVRSLLRRHEMTMRMALGAGRARLVKQLFTEGLLLSLARRPAGSWSRIGAATRSCSRFLRRRRESSCSIAG